ncbi:MAG TPA: aminoacetone oxidase family FAD-binding enzyme [Acidobacteriota bacterium]|nr:aminoacetone oxidase family FAD-binding enzyme [Acidobacteriota bacterium]
MPKRFDVAVVGGGAAGLVAAICAARRGDSAVVCERMPRLGKKILVTGGGRCNLTNEELSPAAFTSTSPGLVGSVLGRFGKEDIRSFFKGLGLETYSEGGRVFPTTNQASSVLKVLEMEIGRLGVAVELGFEVTLIGHSGTSFSIEGRDGRRLEALSVILAGGGLSYPALGSNGSAYELAGRFGHRLVTPVPSAVPVLAKDRMCHFLQGQRVRAAAVALVGEEPAGRAEGEVLFTQYGLSGTAVLDVSESLSIAIHREDRADSALVLDLVPFMSAEALAAEFRRRVKADWPAGDLAAGILPDKFAPVISAMAAESGRGQGDAEAKLAAGLKAKRFSVSGTRGWNEAEFTSGGVDAREVDPRTLESKARPGLFLAGEMLDVQGGRGGYNLAWAWASGHVAGLAGR